MNIELNPKIIEKMCGSVSFKKGDSFYRSNKVLFEHYESDECTATVKGKVDFHVTIKRSAEGGIDAKCSCPTLDSFKWDCQHIAAVLLSIYDHQLQGLNPIVSSKSDHSANPELTEGLFHLFNTQPIRVSRQQPHFENRQVQEVEFICKPVKLSDDHYLGIEVTIGSFHVQNIRDFIEHVRNGQSFVVSSSFTFDPRQHCFTKETDAVIQQLLQVIQDEKLYANDLFTHWNNTNRRHMILLSPSSWEILLPLLLRTSKVKVKHDDGHGGTIIKDLCLSEEVLPLHFDFSKDNTKAYQLFINGMDQLILLNSYRSVLFEGKLIRLEKEDSQRLSDLKQMLETSGTNQLLIPQKQLTYFMEKVIPELKRLGTVHISKEISKQFEGNPLIAKLYLDRVKDRLLAGLEFHYGNIMINPLEDSTSSKVNQTQQVLIRDVKKEEAILKLMEESLFHQTESGYFLHNEELEYEFLYHIVPKLQKLVQLYATTAVRNRIFRGNARPQIRVKSQKERINWLEFKFELDGIPDTEIKELLQALEEKRKYYRLRNGSLFSLETKEIEEVRRFLNAIPTQKEDVESGLHLPVVKGLQLLDSVHDQNIFKLEKSFSQLLNNIGDPSHLEFKVPKSLETVLRKYQVKGYKWIKALASYGFGGVLADDMGLGKTLQSITFIVSELPTIRTRKRPVLIVCPASLLYNWQHEIMKFAPDVQAVIIDGNKTERMKKYHELLEKDVIITSYPLLRKDIKEFEKHVFHTVFYDEAQAFKNPNTQTAKSVKRLQADNRFALTGTPLENSLEDLWSIFHVVFPELFLGLKEFSNLTKKKITRRIRPFMLRRLKEDVLSELPEKNESMEFVKLFPEQKKLYAAYLAKLRHETLKHLDKDTIRKNRIKILAGLTRLRQICCHPALFVDGYKGSSAKFERLKEIVKEAQLSGRRVLIFSQFTKMLELISRELASQGLPFFYLDGQTSSEERLEICHRFNAGERDLFLISLKAGGTGLNLTGADTVILYDTWWNPAVEEQAADRAHRMGQVNVVEVIKLIARGTIEEKINELQEKKKHLIEEIIDSDEKSSSTLTEADIREILMTE